MKHTQPLHLSLQPRVRALGTIGMRYRGPRRPQGGLLWQHTRPGLRHQGTVSRDSCGSWVECRQPQQKPSQWERERRVAAARPPGCLSAPPL